MLKERLGKELLFFDGGTGTLLQELGLKPGELPETWGITRPQDMINIHKRYFEAGSDLVLSNTFGASPVKFHCDEYSLKDIVTAAIENVKAARNVGVTDGREAYVGLDIGPTGKLLAPLGDLSFEDAYKAFAEMVVIGEAAGADFIHIETMSDTYELKAAVLAAKENSSLPVFATASFDEKGRLLTGGDVLSVVALLEGLRVDALGLNCSTGPLQMMPIIEDFLKYSSLPVIVKPNAGLPVQRNGAVCYDVTPEEFAGFMKTIIEKGPALVGGCCGTTPEYIKAVVEAVGHSRKIYKRAEDFSNLTVVSSYGRGVAFSGKPLIIGERINPTGKKRFKQALKDGDIDYILGEAIDQQDAGAHILDVNVGLPDIDEAQMMQTVVKAVQEVSNLPLQIDTVDIDALEKTLRIYNGKAMVNSVNGKQESMDAVFPIVQKYGGVVVGLTLDETGIPETAEARADVAGRIIAEATKYGIPKKDIVIDVLTLTISSGADNAKVTLDSLKLVRERYGVNTVLGVSNVSFGLPYRAAINSHFFTLAMYAGLTSAIINPMSFEMMQSYFSYCALMGMDENCSAYIERFADCGGAGGMNGGAAGCRGGAAAGSRASDTGNGNSNRSQSAAAFGIDTLAYAIVRGLKDAAPTKTDQLLASGCAPLDIISTQLIPALNEVGNGFERGTLFLPQLLMSADAAKAAFSVIKDFMVKTGSSQVEKGEKVILATVKGDIHDIGKNIVKVLLDNYGFNVIDLGKDVAPELIVETAIKENVTLVGLSALMTTTVSSMDATIKLLHQKKPDCKIMVGGAVLNQEYADMIKADFYGKDAMQSVHYAQQTFRLTSGNPR